MGLSKGTFPKLERRWQEGRGGRKSGPNGACAPRQGLPDSKEQPVVPVCPGAGLGQGERTRGSRTPEPPASRRFLPRSQLSGAPRPRPSSLPAHLSSLLPTPAHTFTGLLGTQARDAFLYLLTLIGSSNTFNSWSVAAAALGAGGAGLGLAHGGRNRGA